MKKIYIIGLLICLSLFLYGCGKPDIIPVQKSCEAQGYITPAQANSLVNLTNKLVEITNYCFKDQNVTPLTYIGYWPELNKSS
jgi:hypothetical protein